LRKYFDFNGKPGEVINLNSTEAPAPGRACRSTQPPQPPSIKSPGDWLWNSGPRVVGVLDRIASTWSEVPARVRKLAGATASLPERGLVFSVP